MLQMVSRIRLLWDTASLCYHRTRFFQRIHLGWQELPLSRRWLPDRTLYRNRMPSTSLRAMGCRLRTEFLMERGIVLGR
jgi:hypothetical protein